MTAPRTIDPLWGTGLKFLIQKGTPEKQARKFLGMLCKDVGQMLAIALVAQAEALDAVDPISWLVKAAQTKKPVEGRLARDSRTGEEIEAANAAAFERLGLPA